MQIIRFMPAFSLFHLDRSNRASSRGVLNSFAWKVRQCHFRPRSFECGSAFDDPWPVGWIYDRCGCHLSLYEQGVAGFEVFLGFLNFKGCALIFWDALAAEADTRDQGFPAHCEEERCALCEDQEEQGCCEVQGSMLQISVHTLRVWLREGW